jgi:hypothetical protein
MKDSILSLYNFLPAILWQMLFIIFFMVIIGCFVFQRHVSKIMILLFVIVSYMCAFGYEQRIQEWIIIDTITDIRLGPDIRYPIVAQTSKFDKAQILKREAAWVKIDYNGILGWIRI